MNIGIIGSGNVGGALGTRWAGVGHKITFSSRNPHSDEMAKLLEKAGGNARAATPAEAVASNDVLLLATPWPTTRQAVESAGPFEGKVLIDATNPLLPNLAGIEYGTTTSGAEQVATWAPGARVVKGFNTIGYNVMENPRFGDHAATLLYCGDDAEAKSIARGLAADIGFEPQDAGPLSQARVLEPLALLWISLAVFHGFGRDIVFQLLRR